MPSGFLMSLQVFTSASTTVFKTFVCDKKAVDGKSYLREDYSLSCSSKTHTFFMVYAGLMIAVSDILYFYLHDRASRLFFYVLVFFPRTTA